jgi:hypothetical protein
MRTFRNIRLKFACAWLKHATRAVTLLAMASTTALPGPAQLHIISTPAGANLSIDGTVRGTTPLTLLSLKPGKHLLKIEKADYNPMQETLTLGDDERATREYKLQPVMGLILIRSTPSGSEIEIDGVHRGTTPALISDLPLGKYQAGIGKPGFIGKVIEIDIAGRNPKQFDVTLTSDSASIDLESDPVGANVTLNGVARGKTPCTINRIPSGSITLEITNDGFESYTESLKLAAGEHQAVTAVLKAIPSDLKIVSIPTGARIYVDNQFRGTAPVTLKELSPKNYRVRAEMAAHDVMLRTIDLGRAASIIEEFRLQRNAGGVDITTEPAGVVVILDGKEIGTTATSSNSTDRVSQRLSLDLITCGTHVITLTKPGFYDSKTEFDIIRDQTTTRHFRMRRRFIPNFEVKTATEVYRGILIEVDSKKNIKLETHPGIFKTIPRSEIRSAKPLREDKLKEDL